jgi:hypothetical protein
VPILDDAENEGYRTVRLLLSNPGGGASLGPRASSLVMITDNDGPSVQFSAASYVAAESAATATITVVRRGSLTNPATVAYSTLNGTAAAGSDYTAQSGTVSFAAGQASRAFTVPILADTASEGDETLLLRLTSPTGAALGSLAEAVLTIRDNDPAGTVQFGAVAFAVAEGPAATTSQAVVTVVRTGGTAGGVTVAYATINAGATAGVDYVAASGTLTFAPGQATATFSVTVNGDAASEGNEAVILTLSSPGGGAVLGALASVPLWIVGP